MFTIVWILVTCSTGMSPGFAMNGGLAFNAVLTLLLDDRFPVTGLMLLDDGCPVAIAVPVVVPMALAHGYAGADRPGANADLVRHRGHRGHRKRAHRCGNKQILLHEHREKTAVAASRSDGTCANKRLRITA